jgi:hypothetical protein
MRIGKPTTTNLRHVAWTVALGLALSVMLALSAGAAECQTLQIDALTITARSGEVDEVRTGIVGNYLWVQTGIRDGRDEYADTVSHQVPYGTSGASVCSDGSVEFTAVPSAVDEVDPGPVSPPNPPLVQVDPMPVPVVIDVGPAWNFLTEAGYAQIVAE